MSNDASNSGSDSADHSGQRTEGVGGAGDPKSSSKHKLSTALRNRLLTGLVVAIPLIVTIWVSLLIYRFILYVGMPVIDFVFRLVNLGLGRRADDANLIVPAEWMLNLFGILTPILIFFFLGVMATNVIGKRVLAFFDNIMLRFPVVSVIYSSLKQVTDSFKQFGAAKNFKRVVFVEYPAPGCRLIAFVTGQYVDRQQQKGVTVVFIPTAPNPMTGFVIIVDDDKVMESSLTIEEATKMILSVGLVSPLGGASLPRPEPGGTAAGPAPINSGEESPSPESNELTKRLR